MCPDLVVCRIQYLGFLFILFFRYISQIYLSIPLYKYNRIEKILFLRTKRLNSKCLNVRRKRIKRNSFSKMSTRNRSRMLTKTLRMKWKFRRSNTIPNIRIRILPTFTSITWWKNRISIKRLSSIIITSQVFRFHSLSHFLHLSKIMNKTQPIYIIKISYYAF